jgi:hypothetical protein
VEDGPGGERADAAFYIRAVDLKTRKLLWKTRLYEINFNPHVEADVQDILVNSMHAVDGHLDISNESGDTFKLELATGKLLRARRVYYYAHADGDQLAYVLGLLVWVAVLVLSCVLLSRSYRTRRKDDELS